jgi:hypothetical protein
MIERISGQLFNQPTVRDSEIVIGDLGEKMMQRVVSQPQRAKQLSQPVSAYVRGIKKLIKV